jgi:hypothetical protein
LLRRSRAIAGVGQAQASQSFSRATSGSAATRFGRSPPFRRCPTRQRAVPARCFLAARASKWRRGLGRSPPFSLLRDRRFRCLGRFADSGGELGRFACA